MSNHLAIATVTATLKRLLREGMGNVGAGYAVTSLRPGSGALAYGVNVFLYQVTANAALRNQDLPRLAFDLHYLLSFYGDEAGLQPQLLMGAAARALHATPTLTPALIGDVVSDPLNVAIEDSDLASQPELVRLTPEALTIEEMSKLWSVLLQTPYVLSMGYRASVVLIDPDHRPRVPSIVTEVHIDLDAEVNAGMRATVARGADLSVPVAPPLPIATMAILEISASGAVVARAVARGRVAAADPLVFPMTVLPGSYGARILIGGTERARAALVVT